MSTGSIINGGTAINGLQFRGVPVSTVTRIFKLLPIVFDTNDL